MLVLLILLLKTVTHGILVKQKKELADIEGPLNKQVIAAIGPEETVGANRYLEKIN